MSRLRRSIFEAPAPAAVSSRQAGDPRSRVQPPPWRGRSASYRRRDRRGNSRCYSRRSVVFHASIDSTAGAAISTLPWAPLGAFLFLLTAGYLIVFTVVGGQTIGKMAAGLRVAVNEGPVDVSHAVVRFLATGVTLLTLGLGYLPALFGSNRRALHDRIAGTDVVRG